VSDAQWLVFCDVLGLDDLKADPALVTNNQRVRERPTLMPHLRERLAPRSAAELADIMERAGLPFAPIRKPEDLFDDPHLLATGGLADITLPDGERAGRTVKTTLLPITMEGGRLGVRLQPPRRGEHTQALLGQLGLGAQEIEDLQAAGVVA
jgi:crotonobetainyl-CoA:carnitine CoA-transferase CaiB-like acyl-CoA transferase